MSMNKRNPIYRILRVIWLFIKRIASYLSYIPYYISKPALPVNKDDKPELVVSFTTYPARVWCLPLVVGSILRQTKLPDKIVLYLSKEQFTNLDSPIFKSIKNQGVELVLVDGDLRSHKKYFYAMKQYPESIIITIDDDIIYDKHMINDLYQSYLRHPNAVSAKRVHCMKFNDEEMILPYLEWDYNTKQKIDVESLGLVATGCGGVLYPPNSLHQSWCDLNAIFSTCLCADDLWLKVMELKQGTPVVLAKSKSYSLKHAWGTDANGLGINNILNNENDKQLDNICKYLDIDLYQMIYHTKDREV